MVVEWPSDFAELWDRVPWPSDSIWRYSVPEDSKPSRIRNALELLCGALWHLELARAIGNFPTEGIIEYRENYKNFKKCIPWQAWVEHHNKVTAGFCADLLTIKYHFSNHPDVALLTLIQTMLVADAAFRLYGARDVLSRIDSLKKQRLPILASPKEVASWLDKNSATFIDAATELQKYVVTLIAFRDWYMHGEIPDEHAFWVLRRFRMNSIGSFSLSKIADSCLAVWIELTRLAIPQLK